MASNDEAAGWFGERPGERQIGIPITKLDHLQPGTLIVIKDNETVALHAGMDWPIFRATQKRIHDMVMEAAAHKVGFQSETDHGA